MRKRIVKIKIQAKRSAEIKVSKKKIRLLLEESAHPDGLSNKH